MKKWKWLGFTILILAASCLFLLVEGTKAIPVFSILKSMTSHFGEPLSEIDQIILWELRLPRIILALIAGAAFAAAGTCQQAVFRNPMADPFILGLAGGAAFGATLAICLNHPEYIHIAAFIGGIGTTLFVERLGSRFSSDESITHLLLAGLVVAAFMSALMSAMMAIYSQQMQAIFFWVMGSVANPPANLIWVGIIIFIGISVLIFFARELDLMALGEQQAFFLGVPIKQTRKIILLLSALIVSLAVSMTGPIGFIGLIVPHLLRIWYGPSHRMLLILSALWGGILLLWADGLIRLVPLFTGLPIGTITALFGSPFFLWILIKRGR